VGRQQQHVAGQQDHVTVLDVPAVQRVRLKAVFSAGRVIWETCDEVLRTQVELGENAATAQAGLPLRNGTSAPALPRRNAGILLSALPAILDGHGVRGGKAMIATLRRRLIAVPDRLVPHTGQLILRLPPRQWPARRDPRPPPGSPRHILTIRPTRPDPESRETQPGATPDPGLPAARKSRPQRSTTALEINSAALLADSGQNLASRDDQHRTV